MEEIQVNEWQEVKRREFLQNATKYINTNGIYRVVGKNWTKYVMVSDFDPSSIKCSTKPKKSVEQTDNSVEQTKSVEQKATEAVYQHNRFVPNHMVDHSKFGCGCERVGKICKKHGRV